MNNYTVSKHRANKFADGVGPMILKFIVGVGLCLGVVAFVLVLTRKRKPCKDASSEDFGESNLRGPGKEKCLSACKKRTVIREQGCKDSCKKEKEKRQGNPYKCVEQCMESTPHFKDEVDACVAGQAGEPDCEWSPSPRAGRAARLLSLARERKMRV